LNSFQAHLIPFRKYLLIFFLLVFGHVAVAHPGEPQFVQNANQWPDPVRFKTDIPSGVLFLEEGAFTYHLYDGDLLTRFHNEGYRGENGELRIRQHAFQARFVDCNKNVFTNGQDKHEEYFNFFLGKDPKKWASKVPAFSGVNYKNLYNKIDLNVYGSGSSIKYDFVLKPFADPEVIQINYQGLDKIGLRDGQLVLTISLGEIIEQRPYAYQIINGERQKVPCNFTLNGTTVAFEFPEGYDQTQELVIDPVLIFSTYSGSNADNFGYTATFDDDGFLYAGGTVFGPGYPFSLGAFDNSFNGASTDIGITKYNTSGTNIVYSTYLGGNNTEMPHSMVVNKQNELFLFGTTSSTNFPTTTNAFDTSMAVGNSITLGGLGATFSNGADIFVSRFSSDGGSLIGSTYLGTSQIDGLNTDNELRYNYADEVRGEVLIDLTGDVYIVTCSRSANFPGTGGKFQPSNAGGQDGIIIKMTQSLSNVLWSSFLGGPSGDAIYSIDIDQQNNLYVAGGTEGGFPVSAGAISNSYGGGRSDGFVSHISANGQTLINSTYYGSTGSYEQNYFVELDDYDTVYVFGQTERLGNAYIQNANYGTSSGGQYISKLSPLLNEVIWSTAFGTGNGTPNISPTAFLVDLCSSVYLSGWGGGPNLNPQLVNNNATTVTGMDTAGNPYQGTAGPNGGDFYLMVLSDDASSLTYASFYGGATSTEHVDGGTSRFDRKGRIYQSVCAGCGSNDDFPIFPNPGAVSATNNSNNCNNGVFKMDFLLPTVIAEFEGPDTACAPFTATFNNNSLEQGSPSYIWDFGDGDSSFVTNPSHTYTVPGSYTITLIITDPNSCNFSDTVTGQIQIDSDSVYTLPPQLICNGMSEVIGIAPGGQPTTTYTWSPAIGLSNTSIPNPTASPGNSTNYTLIVDYGVCRDTIFQTIEVDSIAVDTDNDTLVCSGFTPFEIGGTSFGTAQSVLWSSTSQFADVLNEGPTDSNIIVNPNEGLNYYHFRTTSPLGCVAEDSLLVTISDYAFQVDPDQNICFGDSIFLTAISLNPLDTFQYDWSPEADILNNSDNSSILVNPLVTQTFYLFAVNSIGCTRSDSITVTVSTLDPVFVTATAEQDTILKGNSTVFHGTPASGYSIEWIPATGLSDPFDPDPIAAPRESVNYTFRVTDPNDSSCIVDAQLRLEVLEIICGEPEVFIPNAFTPNGDGENDQLWVRGRNVREMDLTVYDRWGEKMFTTTNQQEGWDGLFKGREVDPTVFVYHLEVLCVDGQRYFKKGDVTVIR